MTQLCSAATGNSSSRRGTRQPARVITLHRKGALGSAGAGELVVCRRGPDGEDLGAVGAVGVPSAGGISFDGEAVVDLGVVAFAEKAAIGQRRFPALGPVDQVVDLGPPVRRV